MSETEFGISVRWTGDTPPAELVVELVVKVLFGVSRASGQEYAGGEVYVNADLPGWKPPTRKEPSNE